MRSHTGSHVSSSGNPRPANERPAPLRSVAACACIPRGPSASGQGCRRAGGSPPLRLFRCTQSPPLASPVTPRHLWDRPEPDPGASPPEDTEGGAGNQAPQAPSGQCSSAWRGRVDPGGRYCTLSLLRSFSVCPCVHLLVTGRPLPVLGTGHERKSGVGGARPPWPPPPRRSQRTRRQALSRPSINYAARSLLPARPDVLCTPSAESSSSPILSTCPGWGGS